MWQDIIKASLIGTDKCIPSVSTLENLQKIGVKSSDIPEIVLQGAGLLTLMRKGGYLLTDFKGILPEVCEKETEKICTTSSISHLKAILEGEYEEALEEFLFLTKQYKTILPAQFLPQFFHYCRGNRTLWAMVEPVIGAKGRWLLKQNEDWTHLSTLSLKTEGRNFEQFSNDETMKQAHEIVALLNNNRFIWADDKKINTELKRFAFQANISSLENLRHLFSTALAQTLDGKIQNVYKILFFRKEMIMALSC
jgi:Family of unknown function (DUF5691)